MNPESEGPKSTDPAGLTQRRERQRIASAAAVSLAPTLLDFLAFWSYPATLGVQQRAVESTTLGLARCFTLCCGLLSMSTACCTALATAPQQRASKAVRGVKS